MLLSILGSTGIGLVWGWLGGNLFDREEPSYRALITFSLATLTLAASILWLSGWREVVFFFCVALLSFLLHGAWRQGLRKQFESSKSD